MPILTRIKQKIFAGSSSNIGQFGSAQVGTKVLSTNPLTLQNLSNYDYGWDQATLSGKKLPPLEEMNGLFYINTYQLSYLFQEGIPEYESTTEYRINSIVKKSGTTELYKSLTDANIGNALTNATYWSLLGDLSKITNPTKATTTTLGVSYLQPASNILINGEMVVDQRNSGASQTITAGASLAYTIDQWYAYCTGANCTGQRVAGTSPNVYNYRFTGASSVSKIGFAQRIEAFNSQHLAGQSATLSVDLANTLLTTITWTMWYANTADTFGTLASPTRTQIATGTFTVNSTLTRYETTISIPSGATTGIEIEFSVGAQTSGTWTIGRAKLELGLASTPFNYKLINNLLADCQRYYVAGTFNFGMYGQGGSTGNAASNRISYPVEMRTTPTTTLSNLTYLNASSATVSNQTSSKFEINNTSVNAGVNQVNGNYVSSAVL